ncbi:tail fiber domain-containing protein, partial [Candidatus Neomarinimicrobiota bacterium]
MNKSILIFTILFLSINITNAQDIVSKLGGTTATETYDVTDSADNLLFRIQGDKGALFTGTYLTGTIPATGEGTRMMWYPRKAAFRVGRVEGTQWDDTNIGRYSTAMGKNTTARGDNSTSMGYSTTASGYSSTAMNSGTTASGESSTAMGIETEASGRYSTAMGVGSHAKSYASVAIGRYNVGGGDPAGWVSTDPLFEIGIGTGISAKANAMTVLNNGKVGIGEIAPDFPLHIFSNYHPWDTKMDHHIKLEVANGWWTMGVDDQAGDADFLFRSSEDSDGYTALIDAATGGYILTSDKRYKKNIEPLSNMLEKIQELEPVTYHRLKQDDDELREIGFLAQDVNAIFPNNNIAKLKGDYWTLTYDNFGTIAIAGIKELKDE